MNRAQRRAERAKQPKCSSCGDGKRPKQRSAVDGKVRCLVCHEMHIKHVGETTAAEDGMTNMQRVKAQQLQEALFKAVLSVYPNQADFDIANIIWQLGILAASFSVQSRIPRRHFVAAMTRYMEQVQDALGVEDASMDEPDDDGPRIILPS